MPMQKKSHTHHIEGANQLALVVEMMSTMMRQNERMFEETSALRVDTMNNQKEIAALRIDFQNHQDEANKKFEHLQAGQEAIIEILVDMTDAISDHMLTKKVKNSVAKFHRSVSS